MDAQERVMRALRHEPVWPLPTFDSFWDEFVAAWRAFAGSPAGHPADHYGIEVAICAADETPFPSRAGRVREDGDAWLERDGWGRLVRRVRGGYFHETLAVAVPTRADLGRVEFEDPRAAARYASFVADVARQRGRRCVFAKIGGPFLRTAFVRGETEFLVDLAEAPGFAAELTARVTEHLLAVGLESLRRGNLFDTGVWIYDDMASNQGPMFSPRHFERVFLPCYRRLVSELKRAGAARVVLHCDGNLEPLLDMLLDAGIDGLNPVEPKAGMDVVRLKARYGRRLAYVGGMCNAFVLPRGDLAEIRRQVECLCAAAADGGVVIGAHSIGPDVRPEVYDEYQRLVRATDGRPHTGR